MLRGGIDLDLSIEDLLKQTGENLGKGFRAIKMKVGRPDLASDVSRVKAMRHHLGEGFPLMVDANKNAKLPQAIRVAKGVADCNLAWFEDPANHAEAVKLMVEHSKLKQEDVEKSYQFLRSKHLFEATGKVSRRTLGAVTDALKELGDIPKDFPVERLVLPGVTELVD